MNEAAVNYNVVFPLAKKDVYTKYNTIDFLISVENKKIVPGSFALTGYAFLGDTAALTPIAAGENIQLDPDVGDHSYFKQFITEMQQKGLVESFDNYPRYVKMKTNCTKFRDSLGTETYNCIEGKCPNKVVRQGYDKGQALTSTAFPNGGAHPFVIKPDICVNKSNVAIPGNQVGVIKIRVNMAPSEQVLFGDDVTSDSGYLLSDIKLYYETIPDDNTRPELNMAVYNTNHQVIMTNNANLSTFVPGLCDSVHMSFIKVSSENAVPGAGSKPNYLRCEPLPGVPLFATDRAGVQSQAVDPNNGAERLYYAINDTDTALVGFTMETRTEMIWNYLRSFNNEPAAYSTTTDRLDAAIGDTYGLGINFGTALDFSQQKFAVEINSKISEPYSCYLYFRMPVSIS